MGWEGHTVGMTDPVAKRAAVEHCVGLLGESAAACRQAGLPVTIVSGGGSGDYTISAHRGVLTEIQAGGAIFCDATYQAWGALTQPSLFVRTVVTSRPTPDRIITDAGFKALPMWTRPPLPVGLPPAQPYRTSAEHGTLHPGRAGRDHQGRRRAGFHRRLRGRDRVPARPVIRRAAGQCGSGVGCGGAWEAQVASGDCDGSCFVKFSSPSVIPAQAGIQT